MKTRIKEQVYYKIEEAEENPHPEIPKEATGCVVFYERGRKEHFREAVYVNFDFRCDDIEGESEEKGLDRWEEMNKRINRPRSQKEIMTIAQLLEDALI